MDYFGISKMRRFMSPWDGADESIKPFSTLRFEQPKIGSPNNPTPTAPEENDENLSQIASMYTNRGPAREAYSQHLSSMPSYADFKPGKMNRVISGIVGAGTGFAEGPTAGFRAAQANLNRPYVERMNDWKNREAVLRTSVDDEETSLRNQIQGFKAFSDAQRNARNDALNAKNINSQIGYRDAQKEHLGDSNWQNLTDETTGMYYRYNRASGQVEPLMKTKLSPEEAAKLEVNTDFSKKENSFGFDKKMAGVNFGNSKALAGINHDYSVDLADRNNKASRDRTLLTVGGANLRNDASIKAAGERTDKVIGATNLRQDKSIKAADERQDKSIAARQNTPGAIFGKRLNDAQEYVAVIGKDVPEVREFFEYDKGGNPVSVKALEQGMFESDAAFQRRKRLYDAMIADLFDSNEDNK